MFEQDVLGFRLRFVTNEESPPRILYGKLAVRLDDSNWSLVEFIPTDNSAEGEEDSRRSAQTPLPLPEHCYPICVRYDQSGTAVFALIDNVLPMSQNVETLLFSFWKTVGWSVDWDTKNMMEIFPIVCRKEGKEIGVRFVHSTEHSTKVILLDLHTHF